jgi:hypothetical protein
MAEIPTMEVHAMIKLHSWPRSSGRRAAAWRKRCIDRQVFKRAR